jgi:transketolase
MRPNYTASVGRSTIDRIVQTLDDRRRLREISRRVRERILEVVWRSGSGHVGAALSQADLLVALYFAALAIDPREPNAPSRDRFVLSKGHGGLGLAAVLAERGFITQAELAAFGRSGHAIGMHLDRTRVSGVEVSTGSLGHGLGVAVGIALGAKLQGATYRTVCLLSDGECYEGSTWEAAIAAPAQRLARLVAIVDRNRMTMDGDTEREVPLEPLAEKWRAFGWRVIACDGHDFDVLCPALADALSSAHEGPTVVLAETVKGKGVSFMEARAEWHYGALDSAMLARAIADVRGERKPADVRVLVGQG